MRKLAVAVALILLSIGPLVGCGNSRTASGLDKHDQQMSDRLTQIMEKTHGDWNKLTPADREYLIKDVSQGNEQSARMLMSAASGGLQHKGPSTAPTRGSAVPPPTTATQ